MLREQTKRNTRSLAVSRKGIAIMADESGSSALGVMVGALLVVFIGAAVLIGTGAVGQRSSGPSLTIKMPAAK